MKMSKIPLKRKFFVPLLKILNKDNIYITANSNL